MTDGSGYGSWGDDGRHYAVTLFSTPDGLARELEDVAPPPAEARCWWRTGTTTPGPSHFARPPTGPCREAFDYDRNEG